MIRSCATCSYCVSVIDAGDGAKKYSVVTDGDGFMASLIEDDLVPGALHLCSDNCLYKREQGIARLFGFDCIDRWTIVNVAKPAIELSGTDCPSSRSNSHNDCGNPNVMSRLYFF
jgi:hypothetical protein